MLEGFVLDQNDKKIKNVLFAMQGVGAAFVTVFLAAYLGGLFMNPSTTVLHNELAFRIPLAAFGVALLALILSSAVLAAVSNQKNKATV